MTELELHINNTMQVFTEQEIAEKAALYDYLVSDNWVAQLSGNEFQKDGIPLTEKVTEFYRKNYNGKVERIDIGEVILDKKGVKDSLAHGIGSKKSAAFVAVPSIIKNGKIIDHQTNWKGRGKETYVLSAPIEICKEPYVGIVVITRHPINEKNKFYLHEVLLQKSLHVGVFQDPPLRRNADMQGSQDLRANNAEVVISNNDIAKILKKIQFAKFLQENNQKHENNLVIAGMKLDEKQEKLLYSGKRVTVGKTQYNGNECTVYAEIEDNKIKAKYVAPKPAVKQTPQNVVIKSGKGFKL